MISVVDGAPIECSGGIQIIDFSPELGDAGLEIHLSGVPYPRYVNFFYITWKHTKNNLDRKDKVSLPVPCKLTNRELTRCSATGNRRLAQNLSQRAGKRLGVPS